MILIGKAEGYGADGCSNERGRKLDDIAFLLDRYSPLASDNELSIINEIWCCKYR